MKKYLMYLALVLAIGATGVAPAANEVKSKSAKPALEFSTLDSNGDGKISLTEVQYVDDLRETFGALDANSDAELSPAEFSKWGRAGKSED